MERMSGEQAGGREWLSGAQALRRWRGLSSVSYTHLVRQTGTPRAVAPLVPMGANAGGPHNVEQQTQIVKATLEQLVEIQTPGKIVPLPFEYVAKI